MIELRELGEDGFQELEKLEKALKGATYLPKEYSKEWGYFSNPKKASIVDLSGILKNYVEKNNDLVLIEVPLTTSLFLKHFALKWHLQHTETSLEIIGHDLCLYDNGRRRRFPLPSPSALDILRNEFGATDWQYILMKNPSPKSVKKENPSVYEIETWGEINGRRVVAAPQDIEIIEKSEMLGIVRPEKQGTIVITSKGYYESSKHPIVTSPYRRRLEISFSLEFPPLIFTIETFNEYREERPSKLMDFLNNLNK